MAKLSGKVALVTGASRGMGMATAYKLAELGASLYLAADGIAAELTAVAAECRRRSKGEGDAKFGIFDLSVVGTAEKMVAAADAAFGRIDILVNNAGARCRKPFGTFENAEFDMIMNVNLRAPFFACQAVIPIMRRNGGGRIINIASQMGLVAKQNISLYAASKSALIQLTRSMAFELMKEGITINTVSPGAIETQYATDRLRGRPELRQEILGHIPLGRLGEPDEVAEVIVFLASCDGNFIQGHNLIVDGGHVIH